jgi:Uma2 family endonuclease
MVAHLATPTAAPADKERIYQWFTAQYWTEEAYLALSETTNRSIELSAASLVILPRPTSEHQNILLAFALFMRLWLRANHPGGHVMVAAHPIRLWPGKSREPDVMVWTAAHRDRVGQRESGPPDLALEILSPSNSELDLQANFHEYAEAGIPEYWIVDPGAQRVTVHHLQGSAYQSLGHFGIGEHAASIIFSGFTVAVDELFAG